MTVLELDENKALFQIRSYRPGLIKINNQIFTQSLIISPDLLIENWAPQNIEELTENALEIVLPLKPEVLLIGTGNKMMILPEHLYGQLINQGIGVEFMDTSAACRTYNALSAEGRKVVAALIIN